MKRKERKVPVPPNPSRHQLLIACSEGAVLRCQVLGPQWKPCISPNMRARVLYDIPWPAEAWAILDVRRTTQRSCRKRIQQHQSAWKLIPEEPSVLLEFEEDSEVIEVSNKAIVNKKGEMQGSDLQCQGQSHRCVQT